MLRFAGKLLVKAFLVLLYIPFHIVFLLFSIIYVVGGILFKALGIIVCIAVFVITISYLTDTTVMALKDFLFTIVASIVMGYILFFLPNIVALAYYPLGEIKERLEWHITVW